MTTIHYFDGTRRQTGPYIIGYHVKGSDHCHQRLIYAQHQAHAQQIFNRQSFGRYRSQDIIIDYVWEEA